MPSYEHEKLIERIAQLDVVPDDGAAYASWIEAGRHLDLLRNNAQENELAIYASGDYTFIHAAIVSEDNFSLLTQEDLLKWQGHPFSPSAGYVCVGGQDEVGIERGEDWGTKKLEGARQLVFKREFEGWEGDGRSYFEILQEYAHLVEIHWRLEEHAYCRFGGNGDLEHVVSVTSKKKDGPDVTLVSFKWEPLEQYLAASNSVLIRRFDFTLYRHPTMGWPDGPEDIFNENEDFFYRQKNAGYAAYTYGVQIIRPRHPKNQILSLMRDRWTGRGEKQYVEFIANDWRNNCLTTISTDPTATTNYFEYRKNSLPFELSPAFFRPEVMSKYKTDRDKYTVRSREIRCRNAWVLQKYDVNEADQVHAYICYLRDLPYEEQLYWRSFNEKPKAGISQRALRHDFEGEMVLITDSLDDVLEIVERWTESGLAWWKLREENLLKRVNKPLTTSRDEWAEAFMDLSKLLVEGFQVKAIRMRLREADIAFSEEDKSIALLEKLLANHHKSADLQRLEGLRTVQNIRNKVKGHSGGRDATNLSEAALMKHGTYSSHFNETCRKVVDELKRIEQGFSLLNGNDDSA